MVHKCMIGRYRKVLSVSIVVIVPQTEGCPYRSAFPSWKCSPTNCACMEELSKFL